MRATMALAVALMLSGAAAAATLPPTGAAAMVPMTVRAVGTLRGNPVVLLEDARHTVRIPIWIGELEATAIDLRLHGQKPPRPLTHDLFESTLAALGAHVERAEVVALRDDVFIGRLTVRDARGVVHVLDARSSDTIALALGAGLPVLVAPSVVQAAGLPIAP